MNISVARQSEGEGSRRQRQQLFGAGIMKGFLLRPMSKGEPLRGLKQMKGHCQICHLESAGCSAAGVGGEHGDRGTSREALWSPRREEILETESGSSGRMGRSCRREGVVARTGWGVEERGGAREESG